MPLVSCICPTYARPPDYLHLLAEAVESFTRQKYHNKELLLLNDCPDQKLSCDVPQVRVVNVGKRYSSLGEKYNAAIEMADGQIILPWEDDDISLPNRISQAVECISWGAYWNPQRTWFLSGETLHSDHVHGICHNASAFRRFAWRDMGGYPSISGAQDAVMDGKLKALGGQCGAPLSPDPSEWTYIYRWGVSPVHLSGRAPHDDWYREVGRLWVQPGAYRIVPGWRQDYEAMAAAHVAAWAKLNRHDNCALGNP